MYIIVLFCAGNGDYESVWRQHCQDRSLLSEYAECMQKLAVNHWTKKSQTRIDWCRDIINEYFTGGGLKKALEKEAKRRRHRNVGHQDGQSQGSNSVSRDTGCTQGQAQSVPDSEADCRASEIDSLPSNRHAEQSIPSLTRFDGGDASSARPGGGGPDDCRDILQSPCKPFALDPASVSTHV